MDKLKEILDLLEAYEPVKIRDPPSRDQRKLDEAQQLLEAIHIIILKNEG